MRIGWFEGGIAWVPWALQDAEHLLASYQHMFNHKLEHDIQYYWDTHMSASFMVDPLGLELIDRIGVDKVMWSSYFPIMTVERTLREGRHLPLRPEAMAGYLGDNAARVFGTPEPR